MTSFGCRSGVHWTRDGHGSVDRLGDRAREHGLRRARYVLEEHVPAARERAQDEPDLLGLAVDDRLDVLAEAGRDGGRARDPPVRIDLDRGAHHRSVATLAEVDRIRDGRLDAGLQRRLDRADPAGAVSCPTPSRARRARPDDVDEQVVRARPDGRAPPRSGRGRPASPTGRARPRSRGTRRRRPPRLRRRSSRARRSATRCFSGSGAAPGRRAARAAPRARPR